MIAAKPALGNTQVFRPGPGVSAPPTPDEPPTPAAALRALLASGLRPYQRRRIRACRVTRIGPSVQLVSKVSAPSNGCRGSLVVRGVSTCGSVHSCPMCAAPILAERSREITAALDAAEREHTLFVTFTLRHNKRLSLRLLRLLLSRAHTKLKSGRSGEDLRAELGHVGDVRAAEVTWGGRNGWHPHMHSLWFLCGAVPADYQKTLATHWQDAVQSALSSLRAASTGLRSRGPQAGQPYTTEELAQRVGAYYARHLKQLQDELSQLRDAQVIPDVLHGVRAEVVATGRVGHYLSKLGCELGAITNAKAANPGHYTHWQLAQWVKAKKRWAIRLWREYSEAMLGARQLTWSRGIRERLGLRQERPDELLAAELTDASEGETEHVLAEVPGRVWDTLARQQRQALIARLHDEYARGELGVQPGPAHVVVPQVDGRPRNDWQARMRVEGRRVMAAALSALAAEQRREEQRENRRWMSREERDLEVEELRDHLREEHGIGPPSIDRSNP